MQKMSPVQLAEKCHALEGLLSPDGRDAMRRCYEMTWNLTLLTVHGLAEPTMEGGARLEDFRRALVNQLAREEGLIQ